MRRRSALIGLVAAALLAAGGRWWTAHEPAPAAAYAGLALTPAVTTQTVTPRRYATLGEYGFPGSRSYRGSGGSLADRLPRRSVPLIRQIRPLNSVAVFGYVVSGGGGGFLLQFVCDGTGPVRLTSTDPNGATVTTAVECADAGSVRSFRYVGPAALRIASTARSDGRLAVQIVRLGR